MRKRIILAGLALAALGGGLWWWLRPAKFLYAGTIEAEEVDVSPGVAAQIASLKVAEGDTVKAGQVLAELDCREIRLAAALAEDEFVRGRSLFASGNLSRQNFDRLRYTRDDAAVKAGWCTVTAPSAGTVQAKYQSAGEWARPGQRLLTLADVAQPYVYVYVEQPRLARLALGAAVKAGLPEMPGTSFAGRIAHIRDQAEFTPKNVQTRDERARLVFGVKVALDNASGVLKPGMPIEVDLGLD